MFTKDKIVESVATRLRERGGFWYSTTDVFGGLFTRESSKEEFPSTVRMLESLGILDEEVLIAYGESVDDISVHLVKEVF